MDQLKERISPEIYETLIKVNITSLPTIISSTTNELRQLSKLNVESINTVAKESANIVLKNKVCSANSLPSRQRIKTGCSSIDKLIKGIALTGITEIVGCSGVGKTQFCLQLALMTQLPPTLGGLEKCVVYICTEDAFPVKRLSELGHNFTCKHKNLHINFEDNIYIEHIADGEQLKKCVCNKLSKLLSVKNVGLIVIDSIAGAFRSENLEVNYSSRSQDFVLIVSKLNRLSEKYSVAIVTVNQVTDSILLGCSVPCLGLAWSNLVTTRLNISRHVNCQERTLEVVFSPDLPSDSCKFTITSEGLIDVK